MIPIPRGLQSNEGEAVEGCSVAQQGEEQGAYHVSPQRKAKGPSQREAEGSPHCQAEGPPHCSKETQPVPPLDEVRGDPGSRDDTRA